MNPARRAGASGPGPSARDGAHDARAQPPARLTRVLQVMAGARFGGAEAFFVRLNLALAGAGVKQRAVIRGHPERAAELRAGGVEVAELRFGGPLDVQTRRALRREIAAFDPGIVLSWMNRATRFVPTSESCKGAGGFVHVGRLGGYYDLKYYRNCGCLIGNTRDIVDYVIGSGWPEERVHYLPNFVDAAKSPPARRAAFSTPEGAPLLLALGRLHVNKGFDVLIEALVEIPDAHLWLAGEGPLRGELEGLAGRLGLASRVHFLGWRTDVASLFAAADMLVCPSRHEPLGNVVIEAWAQNVPVIAAASAGPTALIENDENGLVVAIDDKRALAGAIGRLGGDAALSARLVEGGRQAFEAEFRKDAVLARYLEFFAKVTG